MELGKEKVIALLLSALVLPGAGQIYLKERVKGTVIAIAVTLTLMLPIIHYVMRVNRLLSEMSFQENSRSMIGQIITAMSTAWSSEKTLILICVAGIIILWFYGILDILLRKK